MYATKIIVLGKLLCNEFESNNFAPDEIIVNDLSDKVISFDAPKYYNCDDLVQISDLASILFFI